MTRDKNYDILLVMNTKKIKITGIILCLAVLCTCFAFLFSIKPAYAAPTSQKEIFLPTSELENTSLTAPIDVYSGDEIIILQSANEILLSKNGELLSNADFGVSFTNLKQVKNFSDEYFLVSDSGSVYTVSKEDFSKSPLIYNSNVVGGNYFDLNQNFLITAFSDKATVYQLENGQIVSELPQFDVRVDKPICINDAGQIFYVNQDVIQMKDANSRDASPITIAEISPDKMIANNQYLYLINNNKIFRVDIETKTLFELENLSASTLFDLGNIVSPSSICFNGENLIVADSNAVQEFSVAGDKLEFTGYAIASGKTAYNRISVSASKIERNDNYLAVKDGNKLCVIKNVDGFDGKDQKYFKNFFELGNFDKFCVGEGVILLTYQDNTVKILNIEEGTLTNATAIPNGDIMDVSYGNGGFYVATNVSTTSYIYKVLLDGTILTNPKTLQTAIRLFVRDQENNDYILDEAGKLYKNDLETVLCENVSGATEIQVDLDGTIYLLVNNKINVAHNGSLMPVHSDDVKTFTLSFDKKQVYFLKDNEEFIYQTTSIENHAIEDITIPTEYKLTDISAYVDNLAVCTVNTDASVYLIDDKELNFDFLRITEKENQYLFICDIQVGDTQMTALAGQNGIVLTYKSFTEKTSAVFYNHPAETYVTTGVHVYYLPLITMDMKFVLVDDNQVIRLEKGTKITPLKAFSAVDRDYYYAEITLGEKTYKGYIPKEFTVDVLAEDKAYSSFKFGKVSATSVYLDAELITEIATLSESTSVRIASIENGVAEIYFRSGEVWLKGYIAESAIIIEQNNSIRNAIMLLIAVTCVCSTIIYFMFKKKS